MTIQEHIRDRREASGLTQAQLAELVGVHRAQVNRWERGRHEIPGPQIRTLGAVFRLQGHPFPPEVEALHPPELEPVS